MIEAAVLKDRLRADLKAAMRARQVEETNLLRVLIAAIDDAEAVPLPEDRGYASRAFGDGSAEAPRRALTAEMLQQILHREIAARTAAADEMDRVDRPDRTESLRRQAAIIARYL
jgi:uncharacterized protein YqeY